MTLRHLRIFQIVCEEQSITRAAEKLFMTQPAVTHTIQELEQHLDIRLFDRISRKIYLNETGKLFLEKVDTLLELYDELERSAKSLEDRATLRIGSSITIANFFLSPALEQFQQACPHTPTRITIDNARNIENLLMKNEIDLGLIEGVIYHEQLTTIPFSSYDLVVVCAPTHVLAGQPPISLDFLVKQTWLLREKGSATRDVFDSGLLLHNRTVTPAWTSVNSPALIHGVKQNLGVSILPRVLVREDLERGSLVEVPVEDFHLTGVNHIAYHKNKARTPSFQALVEIMQQIAKS